MDLKQKEIHKTLQVLLWLWFGTITSFAVVNVVNISKLETETKMLQTTIQSLRHRILVQEMYKPNYQK